ncbi:MAG TPA: hypothetical protein VIM57_00620 [Luteolibacter sp.]
MQLSCDYSEVRAMERLRRSRFLLGALASALLFQFTLMLAMAAWSPLHRELHCDADQQDHQCEVTLWSNGSVDAVPPPVIVPQQAAVIELPEVPPTRTFAAFTATHLLGGVMAQGPPRGP